MSASTSFVFGKMIECAKDASVVFNEANDDAVMVTAATMMTTMVVDTDDSSSSSRDYLLKIAMIKLKKCGSFQWKQHHRFYSILNKIIELLKISNEIHFEHTMQMKRVMC